MKDGQVQGNRSGIVRFRPADITGPEVDRQLRTVIQTAGHVKEYMRIFERAPALKAIGLEDSYKVLADFGDAVLAGRSCKTGAKFVTWEWDFDRQGVHAGHYFMENYEAAKQDFAVRAGLVESQRLFSDEQIAVIKNACEFALEDDATLSYAEEKQLHSVQAVSYTHLDVYKRQRTTCLPASCAVPPKPQPFVFCAQASSVAV